MKTIYTYETYSLQCDYNLALRCNPVLKLHNCLPNYDVPNIEDIFFQIMGTENDCYFFVGGFHYKPRFYDLVFKHSLGDS